MIQVFEEDSSQMVTFLDDYSVFSAELIKISEGRTKHWVSRDITKSAVFIKLFQSGLHGCYIAYDAVFSKMRQYLSEGIERIFYRCGIDYQFRMEILYFFHIGEAVAIVHKAQTFWVYIIYSHFVFKA